MSKKIFVGGLSWGIDEDGLREAFEGFGEIEYCRLVTDRETGRSKGFGFVTFVNDEDADKAISEMDGQELEGRKIGVNLANERNHQPRY